MRWFNGVWTNGEEPGQGQATQGGGTPSIPTFNFDYEKAAQEAYGELGAYYDRILKESQGDLTLALSRLTEDYDRGLRIKKEDTATSQQDLAQTEKLAQRRVQDNALARGLYQNSVTGAEGKGIPDQDLIEAMYPINRQRENVDLNLRRYEEGQKTGKTRTEQDLRTRQERYEYDQEQNRRKEAASIANDRGSRAFNRFQTSLF